MKVYQINVVCGYGSTGRIVADLSRFITKTGGECRIAYGRGTAPADLDTIKISNQLDLYYHSIMTRFTDKHGLYSKNATKKLINDIIKYNPDIIHLHNIHGYYVNYEILFEFLKGYDKQVIWTLHDCWTFTGHCAYYDAVACEQWKEECHQCNNLKGYPSTYNNSNIYFNYLKKRECFTQINKMILVSPSKWLKDQIKQSFFKDTKCVVIRNGINIDLFSPKKRDIIRNRICPNQEKMILGVASVWTEQKGFSDFVKLRKVLDEKKYVICMVGLNRKQLAKLPHGIIGISRTESIEELAEYYSAADVFVNLTYEDTFPTTNIEALACGTPILTYETGGSPEIINENCGDVVSKGDIEEMKRCIMKWCEQEKPVEACVARGHEYILSDKYAEYINLYGACINNESIVFD